MRAVRKAWRDKGAPGTLVDTPAAWERLLGSRVHYLEPFLRHYFIPDPVHAGRVSWPLLSAKLDECRARYELSQERGARGGTAPTTPGKARGRPRKYPRPLELQLPNGATAAPEPPPAPAENSPTNSPTIFSPSSPRRSAVENSRENSRANTDLRRVSPVPNGTRVKTRRGDAPLDAAGGRSASPRGSPPPRPAARHTARDARLDRRRRLDDEPDTLPGELPPDVDWRALLAHAAPERAPPPVATALPRALSDADRA